MTKNPSVYERLASEFSVGQIFDGKSEHWSERETVKPIWQIRGEILEIKPNGLCIDDGAGDEIFLSFATIQKHRVQLQRDYRADMDMILSKP